MHPSTMRHCAILPFVLTLLFSTALAGQKQPRSGAPKAAGPKAAGGRGVQRGGENPRKADRHPGEQVLDRLQQMTPAQRQKWLQNLPPERRQRIEKALQAVAKMSPATKTRVRDQLERLNSLPPQKQVQVRRALRQFNNMPEERKAQISDELQRMSAMPDDERRAHMNSEEFRNRYSPVEQRMMSNLNEITPE